MTDLLADIGGTHARVAFRKDREPWPHVFRRRTADFPSLEALLADVIAEAGEKPVRAMLAVPGPVAGARVTPANLDWEITLDGLKRTLGAEAVRLVNDLEAVAWSLPHLTSADLVTWRTGKPAAGAARVVVAPGTGLGVGALVPHAGGWAAVPSEGGHALSVMPRAVPDSLRKLWRGAPSWEDLLSGGGLLRIHNALGESAAAPAEVTERARRNDPRALEAIAFFSELLGACAGDMAMIFAAKGGCYIAGGVVPALGKQFDVARFISGFADKGAYSPYVGSIPLALIAHPTPALVGLAALLDSIAPGPSR